MGGWTILSIPGGLLPHPNPPARKLFDVIVVRRGPSSRIKPEPLSTLPAISTRAFASGRTSELGKNELEDGSNPACVSGWRPPTGQGDFSYAPPQKINFEYWAAFVAIGWLTSSEILVMAKHRVGLWQSLLIALCVAIAPVAMALSAPDELRKVSVVSIRPVRRPAGVSDEATGAAQVVANRFGAEPVIVRFNTRKGGDATTTSLAATLQATAKNMAEANERLFLILTSHGSPDGLAAVAGRRRETLTPPALPTCSTRRVSAIGPWSYPPVFRRVHAAACQRRYASDHGGRRRPRFVRLRGSRQMDILR